jgi:CHAT domain-containing protein
MAKGFDTGKQQEKFVRQIFNRLDRPEKPQNILHDLLRNNACLLDENFFKTLRRCTSSKLSSKNSNQVVKAALDLYILSDSLANLNEGNIATNLEIAISGFEFLSNILKSNELFYQSITYNHLQANTQSSLSDVYKKRIAGDRSENLERALDYAQNALKTCSRDCNGEAWANSHVSLGNAYLHRIGGDVAENIEQSIQHYRESLQEYTRKSCPDAWAMVQYNMGHAFRVRVLGDCSDNLEQSIQCYSDSLKIRTRERFPHKWAMTIGDLGFAYTHRLHGDREENLEKAVDYCQQALTEFSRESSPQNWAHLHLNLGVAYKRRIRGAKTENIQKALYHYQQAEQVITQESSPKDWALIQSNIGSAYKYCLSGDPKNNIEQSIHYCHESLKVYTKDIFSFDWAKVQINLGNAYRARILGDENQNLKSSVAHYTNALEVLTSEAFPDHWAAAQVNLAESYWLQIVKGNEEYLDIAIHHLTEALKICTPKSYPQECIACSYRLGFIYFNQLMWDQAISSFDQAIEAIEISRSWVVSENRRQEISERFIDVYQYIVQACINAGQLEKALEYVERSRSKRLVELMASNDLYQDGEISLEILSLLEAYDALQAKIDQERVKNTAGEGNGLKNFGQGSGRSEFQAYNDSILSLEAEKGRVWEQLRGLDPVLAGEIQVAHLSYQDIRKLIEHPTSAILSFYTTAEDTYVFVVRQDRISLHTCIEQGLESLQNWIEQNWLELYQSDRQTWKARMGNLLRELTQRLQLQDIIDQHLSGIEELILVPHLLLHQIPFAALPISENSCLGDKFLIQYTPSCQILEFCRQRGEIAADESSMQYGIVEDAMEDLPFSSFEGQQIASLFGIPNEYRLKGRSHATCHRYRLLARQVQGLHSCHHAQSRLDNPLESQLKLADGCITLGQLMTPAWRLPNLSDVFLSCCETNLGRASLTDDIFTLSTGFLCAGARSVISTLWAVDDLATALFSIFYYRKRLQRNSRAESLQQAQIQLRQLKREDLLDLAQYATDGRQKARNNLKLYPQGSVEFEECNREYRKYASVSIEIERVRNLSEAYPFAHPHFWAAFICQGLA